MPRAQPVPEPTFHPPGPCLLSPHLLQHWPPRLPGPHVLAHGLCATPRGIGLLTQQEAGARQAWDQFGCDLNTAGLAQEGNSVAQSWWGGRAGEARGPSRVAGPFLSPPWGNRLGPSVYTWNSNGMNTWGWCFSVHLQGPFCFCRCCALTQLLSEGRGGSERERGPSPPSPAPGSPHLRHRGSHGRHGDFPLLNCVRNEAAQRLPKSR